MTGWAYAMETPDHQQVTADTAEECVAAAIALVYESADHWPDVWAKLTDDEWLELLEAGFAVDVRVVPA